MSKRKARKQIYPFYKELIKQACIAHNKKLIFERNSIFMMIEDCLETLDILRADRIKLLNVLVTITQRYLENDDTEYFISRLLPEFHLEGSYLFD